MKTLKMCLTALTIIGSGAAFADASTDFATLLDEHWEAHLANDPINASINGDRRFNDQWPDESLEAVERRYQQDKEFLRLSLIHI